MKKTMTFGMAFLAVLFLAAACSPSDTAQQETATTEQGDTESVDWRTAGLTDIATGETFSVADFDRPVLLESFAVWCPVCLKQQNNVKRFHEEIGDSVVSIGLNTDPNEDEVKVREYIDRHGFDWYYAISPADVTRSLIDDFGTGVVSAPAAPMILYCDGQSHFLDRGLKSADELRQVLDTRCDA